MSMNPPPPLDPPVTLCTSLDADTAGMNCNGTFPKKNHAGLCAGCTLLQQASQDKVAEMQNYPQCDQCGTRYRFMKAQANGRYMCGPCINLADIPHQSPASSQQQADRVGKMDRLTLARLQSRGGPSISSASQALTPRRPFVNVELFINGRMGKAKAQCVVGNMGFQFESDDLIEDVIKHFLQASAPAWEARHTNSLQISDVCLRLNNNVNLHSDQDVTMREFIQQHLAVPAAQVVPAAHKAAAKKYGVWPAVMYLELHVQADLYTARTNEAVQIGTALTAAKRKLDVDDGQGPKRSRTTATIPYLSSFNPRTDHVDPPAQTKVNLIVIEASSDVNGKVELDESTQHPLPDPTYIHDKSFARGTMKLISPPGENMPEITFVAKRFFQVSSDAEPVSPENNKTFLTEEVLLTSEIHFFLTKFYECGALNEVDLDLSLAATDIWLATELLTEEESKPCPAAGLDDLAEADMADVRETGVAWLIEPLRVGAVQKFSGTLNHKSKAPTTRLAATVNTFIHFVYHFSQKSLVLCDVQTMKARIKGEPKNVIFDPMAHTPKGKCEALGLDELDSDDEESDKE
ncbi:hypothetical protein B0H14DRAFT_3606702 [Mycena olivaceomarginata]|nr:hypothetical protein B0H14DRAFT_3606702 [Mycena olivaceomarginata]